MTGEYFTFSQGLVTPSHIATALLNAQQRLLHYPEECIHDGWNLYGNERQLS
ncbi:hypothetical protein BDR04DRAFT_1091144 [Suillus decipiens]|nr:hypothetical protein BDR04DRAFT_1091144 [Suillus decipiens]